MTLSPYDTSTKCAKCGSERVNTAHHSMEICEQQNTWTFGGARMRLPSAKPAVCATATEDHMLRHCSNCGFEWLEAPMDAYVSVNAENKKAWLVENGSKTELSVDGNTITFGEFVPPADIKDSYSK